MPNLLTRSLLAISAALTSSAAFVPARITAERGKKAKTSAREFSLSNKRNVMWMMQALWRGPRGLCWPGHSGIWVGPEIGYRAKFLSMSYSQGLKLWIFCDFVPLLPSLQKISCCAQSQMGRPKGSSGNKHILGIWNANMLYLWPVLGNLPARVFGSHC